MLVLTYVLVHVSAHIRNRSTRTHTLKRANTYTHTQMVGTDQVMDWSAKGTEQSIKWWSEAGSPTGLAAQLDAFFQVLT